MSITVDDETIMTVSLGPCQINFYSLISRVVLKHFMFQSNYSLGVCKKKGLADLSLSSIKRPKNTLSNFRIIDACCAEISTLICARLARQRQSSGEVHQAVVVGEAGHEKHGIL